MGDIKDFKHAIVRQKILDAVRKDLIGPTSDCEQLNEVPTSSYITGLLYPADTDVTEDENYNDVEFTEKNFDADGETLEAGIFEEEEPEDRVKGGFQKPSSIGVSFYVSDNVQKVNAYINWGKYYAEQVQGEVIDETLEEDAENKKKKKHTIYIREQMNDVVEIDFNLMGRSKQIPLESNGNIYIYVYSTKSVTAFLPFPVTERWYMPTSNLWKSMVSPSRWVPRKYTTCPSLCARAELWEAKLKDIRDNGGSFSYRAAYVRKGEEKNRVHQVSTYLTQEDDTELIWFFTQDITDVIKKRDELRELNLLLDGILNNIPVYLYVKDPEDDFRYLYWNKAFAEHSKIPASRAIGRTDFEIFPERADAERFRRDDLELIRTHERIDMQETYVAATGETRIVQTLKALVPMEGREPLLIGISWDITNFQNIEQELIKARIKAEQSDRLKTAFLANMSHEIRTPLNAIVGFSNLLPSAETLEEEKLYSSIINQNSEILLQLINDILDLSKIEAGTLEYVRQPMNLGEICRNIYQIHKDRVQEGVTLILDNQDEDLIIEEDRNRIAQVITNFLTNAGKFTLSGEIRFGFKVNNQCIRFYVKDTGIGIAPDKVGHIFDRFVKLNSFAQGTGLGLAICRMIIEKIGGEIGVTSEIGKGSTFYFTIPYKESSDDRIAFSEASETKYISHTIKRMQKIKKILVAEDVDSNFVLIKNMIGKDYTLLWAKDGFEAVEMYKQFQPDLILMDIKMPRMGGLEATRIIRSYSKEIPVIALTAYAFEADKEQALEAGCNDFVTKPVSKAALEEALGKCCG